MVARGVISAMVLAGGDGSKARAAFERAGFETGETVGGTFAISAPQELFEKTFKTRLDVGESGVTVAGSTADPHALPLAGLAADLRRGVKIASFSPPPDFGPTNW